MNGAGYRSHEVERDRHGVTYSGPLEVGECIQVIPAPCELCGGYGALNEVTRKPAPCMACGRASEGMVLVAVDPLDQAEPGEQRGGLRVIDGGGESDHNREKTDSERRSWPPTSPRRSVPMGSDHPLHRDESDPVLEPQLTAHDKRVLSLLPVLNPTLGENRGRGMSKWAIAERLDTEDVGSVRQQLDGLVHLRYAAKGWWAYGPGKSVYYRTPRGTGALEAKETPAAEQEAML